MSAVLAGAAKTLETLNLLLSILTTVNALTGTAMQASNLIKKARDEGRDVTQAELDELKASLDDKARAHLAQAIAAAEAREAVKPTT